MVIQQSWDCSKYRLIVLSHLLPTAEHAGSLPKSTEAQKTWYCSKSKALFSPGAAAMSNLMLYPSMPPPESALVPAVSGEPELKAFS